jgi:hypothetical protein
MLILEPAFLLMYYGGFTFKETIHMPISYKRWFIDRIGREMKRTGDEGATASRAAHQNSPEVRSLLGMSREQSPSRLRRFT